jgi:hypothetical protein
MPDALLEAVRTAMCGERKKEERGATTTGIRVKHIAVYWRKEDDCLLSPHTHGDKLFFLLLLL